MTRTAATALSPLLLLLLLALAAWAFNCPDNRQCYCFEEAPAEFRVHCGQANATQMFDLSIQRHERLVIECANSPDWADFMLGSSLEVGAVKTLVFTGCSPPGPANAERVAAQLAVSGVETLKFVILHGSLARQDFTAYPDVKNLILSNNDLGNVTADLLRDLKSLRLLELRNTKIRLPAGFFDSARTLRTIELGSNQLRELQPGTFRGLHSLELLNLWRNDFRKLEPDAFRGLATLVSLDLNQNALSTLPADLFKDLANLEVINLSSNNFSSLPVGLFSANSKLRVAKLLYNKQNLTELPEALFANLTALKSVMITRNGLLRLPQDLFWGATGLENLTMDRNYLTTLPKRLFQNTTNLYSLSLSFNDLKELPDNIFEATNKLTRLDLSKNHLNHINDRMLLGLESLRFLNVENNELMWIHVDAFKDLGNLRVAKFANNRLTLRTGLYDIFGHISPFHHCHSLENLYLAHNNITEMHSDWVVGNTRLRTLDLKYNSFNYLQTEDLQFVSNSVSVDLRHNNISRVVLSRLELMAMNQTTTRDVIVDIADNPIRCDCEVYELLRYLNGDMHPNVQNYVHLRPANLTCDSPDYMLGAQVFDLKAKTLKCLVESEQPRPGDPCSPSNHACNCWLRPEDKALLLDCAARNLTRPPEWIDAQNVAKVELDLRMNKLKEPPSMYKKGYEKVTSLNLARNNISFVDERLLSPNLKVLLLEGNNLTNIEPKILEKLLNSTQISTLSLHDNPWRCDCSSRDLLTFVHSNYLEIADLPEIMCAGRNASLSSLTPEQLCPTSSRLVVLLASMVSAFAVLLGLGAALYFRFQRQIKVWLYSKGMCLCLVSEEEVDKDKIYDAFISYSHKDEDFVTKELVAKLEDGPRPYKLCIHTRDWLAGEWIPAQIARSVDESRRTIIVLTRHFVDSEWGRLEFQAAHKQALSERRARVIVVLHGEIGPVDQLEPDLRSYLQTNTYVKWGEPWFWQKLRYAMPHAAPAIAKLGKQQLGKLAFADDESKGNDVKESIVAINKNLNGNLETRAPQCTTV
ncbi:protein toll-like [Phymastichus coffea]|uniref:protein toll-like n=1 Tax=Phymastichus coffea TaxID=108790 RepID=UPI00273C9315|nr:protein toll-like [Phymastichus coffea]XP_058801643.1 protein toll-like [Phymastichus coffea]